MGKNFNSGQLVTPLPWAAPEEGGMGLYNVPGGARTDDVRRVSQLLSTDVAMIVGGTSARDGNVYVIGPHGGGWTFVTLLRILRDE